MKTGLVGLRAQGAADPELREAESCGASLHGRVKDSYGTTRQTIGSRASKY
jgi:hypothetical protein